MTGSPSRGISGSLSIQFDGCNVEDFLACWRRVQTNHADRLAAGRAAYVYLESPCNPHGYVLDVPGICQRPTV